MRYLPRALEATLLRAHRTFKVLFLGGPRQVGKTTLLKELAKDQGMHYVTLDDLNARMVAQTDPALFLQQHPRPLLIDEVQYAPGLFPLIKQNVDAHPGFGHYWLTGSQQFSLLARLQESLAGRVAILTLLGLSLRERQKRLPQPPFLPVPPQGKIPKPDSRDLWNRIFTGSFPVFSHREPPDRDLYFNSYLQTYLDRDLVDLFGITKVTEFNRFIRACAARTGQVLNMADLARDANVSPVTAKEWLSILVGSHQVILLEPYFTNLTSRITKAPKLHFLDTGLASHLLRFPDAASLSVSMIAGNMFETFVVGEIYKSYLYNGKEAPIFYYRDKEKREVDLVIETSDGIHPVECKLSAKIDPHDFKHMGYLGERDPRVRDGAIVSLIESPSVITKGNYLPYTMI